MKKSSLIVAVLAVFLLAAGCDILKVADILGEWDFLQITEIKGTAVYNVHASIMDDGKKMDIGWDIDGGDVRWHGLDGTLTKNKFTGTYEVFYLGPDAEHFNIEVTLSYENGKLKLEFEGEGPLDGVVLDNGTKSNI